MPKDTTPSLYNHSARATTSQTFNAGRRNVTFSTNTVFAGVPPVNLHPDDNKFVPMDVDNVADNSVTPNNGTDGPAKVVSREEISGIRLIPKEKAPRYENSVGPNSSHPIDNLT
jgi:hypothetical protein